MNVSLRKPQKKLFFSGQSTEAFSPPPISRLSGPKWLQKKKKIKKNSLVDIPLPPPLSGLSTKKITFIAASLSQVPFSLVARLIFMHVSIVMSQLDL